MKKKGLPFGRVRNNDVNERCALFYVVVVVGGVFVFDSGEHVDVGGDFLCFGMYNDFHCGAEFTTVWR
jgi:hypothetical protein